MWHWRLSSSWDRKGQEGKENLECWKSYHEDNGEFSPWEHLGDWWSKLMKYICVISWQRLVLPLVISPPLCSLCLLPQPQWPSIFSPFVSLMSGTLLACHSLFMNIPKMDGNIYISMMRSSHYADLLGSFAQVGWLLHPWCWDVRDNSFCTRRNSKKETWCGLTTKASKKCENQKYKFCHSPIPQHYVMSLNIWTLCYTFRELCNFFKRNIVCFVHPSAGPPFSIQIQITVHFHPVSLLNEPLRTLFPEPSALSPGGNLSHIV